MNEIDWDKVYSVRIGGCCSKAATDLDLSVEVPFVLNAGTPHEATFIALFPSLAAGKGVLVCLASEWKHLQQIPCAQNYMCVGLYPEHYSCYDLTQWKKNVAEWGAGE
jgi:hypothetical protein